MSNMISFHFGGHGVVLRSVFLNWALVFNFVPWAQFQVLLLSFLFGTRYRTLSILHADMHANGGLFFFLQYVKLKPHRTK